jgi:ribosomal RNA-processing protein 1
MSDKPLIQQSLARDLSSLLLSIDPDLPFSLSSDEKSSQRLSASLDFLRGFWEAMVREWEGLDRLRIRRFVGASFELLSREGWSEEAVQEVTDILVGRNGQGPLK